jgi:hypothetical protein
MDDATAATAGWSADRLEALDAAGDIHVAPARPEGGLRRPTRIWAVVVDDDLYVRAYHGPDAAWYRAAAATGRGEVTAARRSDEVGFTAADPALADPIDRAYAQKYGRSAYVDAMVAEGARATTLLVRPAASHRRAP